MRLDRFISLNVARPFQAAKSRLSPSPRWGEGRGEVLPILMYHSLSDNPESGIQAYYRTVTNPAVFRQHMALLKSEGYQGVDLPTGLEWLSQMRIADCGLRIGESETRNAERGRRNAEPETQTLANEQRTTNNEQRTTDYCTRRQNSKPETRNPELRPVVLTFDDGFRDFHTVALPVLAEFGFTATMFLPTAFIHEERRAFKGTDCMTWSEVRESQKFGVHFGAHTVSHAKLYELTWPRIESELSNSKSEIEQQLARPVSSFAYPYAFPQVDTTFCGRFRETLIGAGYESCVTTIAGRAAPGDDPYTLRRLPVNGADDPVLFRAKLAGFYDWMEPAQWAAKRLKRILANGSRNPVLDRAETLKS